MAARRIASMLATCFVLCCAAFAASAQRSTVTVLTSGSPEYLEVFDRIIAAFEERNPDLDVEVVVTDWATGSFRVMDAAGTTPDLVRMNETVELGTAGLIEDLTPRVMSDPDLGFEDFIPPAIAALGWNGRIYALPFGITVNGIFYNKNLLDAAGVPHPSEDWAWEREILEYGRRVTRMEGDGRYSQFFLDQLGATGWAMFLYAKGGRVWSDDGSRFTAGTEDGIEALQFTADLWNQHHIAPTFGDLEAGTYSFAAGNVAVSYAGSWRVGAYRDSGLGFEWDVANVPTYGGHRATYLWAETPWGLPVRAPNKEGAWRLLRFFVSEEGQRIIAQTGLAMPIRRSVALSPAFLEQGSENIAAFVAAASAPRTHVEPVVPGWSRVWPVLNDNLVQPVYRGETSAALAMQAVISQINAILAEVQRELGM